MGNRIGRTPVKTAATKNAAPETQMIQAKRAPRELMSDSPFRIVIILGAREYVSSSDTAHWITHVTLETTRRSNGTISAITAGTRGLFVTVEAIPPATIPNTNPKPERLNAAAIASK
jgi:hypothetical protein